MTTYTPTIGIEVHAELKTNSKMFCGCPNDPHGNEPNSNICPICLGHPGTLPTVNKEAVRALVMIGEAIGGTIATYSEFDRKHYFYPDIPKAYQISQYQFPFVQGGSLAGVEITRVHLEEDTARSSHDGDTSLVDFNRAGVPLMELVTEPVIHDAATAANFARELQLLLRTLGVSDANMERGEMRVEANVSISSTDTLGTKVEVKNLNSFRSVEMAIAYEISRQQKEEVVAETRGWDEQKNRTFSQRVKETADDYRYFPDPDIPRFDLKKIGEFESSRIQENMPELPNETRMNLSDLGVDPDRIELLLAEPAMLAYFHAIVPHFSADKKRIMVAVNYLTSDIAGLLQQDAHTTLPIENVPNFAGLVDLVAEGSITSRVAKDILPEVVFEGKNAQTIAKERGLLQKNSADELIPIVDQILAEHESVVADYKAGKEASLQFLIGQGMKATKGAANPAMLADLLKERMSA